jgi:hypothetical protein
VGDAWPYSPRLQGRKNVYSILPFWLFGGFDFKSLRSTKCDYPWVTSMTGTVYSGRFCLLGLGLIKY